MGWYKEIACTTPWNVATDTVLAHNITLYAKWDLDSFQVTFDTHGGSAVPSQSVYYANKVVQPADPACGTIEFEGWYTDTTFATPWNFSANTITGATTIYAKWHYEIGDAYCGGIIYYLDGTENHGLIASLADQNPAPSAGVAWSTANTLCSGYYSTDSYGTYGGWRLATLSELATLYAQKTVVGSSSFLSSRMYWSSTPQPSSNYWYLRFDDGYQGNTVAGNTYVTINYSYYDCRARAVKSF